MAHIQPADHYYVYLSSMLALKQAILVIDAVDIFARQPHQITRISQPTTKLSRSTNTTPRLFHLPAAATIHSPLPSRRQHYDTVSTLSTVLSVYTKSFQYTDTA